MKELVLLAMAFALATTVRAGIEVSSSTLTAEYSSERHGIVSLRGADGTEFAAGADGTTSLFTAALTREDDYTNTTFVTAWNATRTEVSETNGALRIVFSGFPVGLVRVVCDISPGGGDLAWRIGFETRTGWLVHDLAYPRLSLTKAIGADGADDAIVMGNAKGGIRRNPSARAAGMEIVSGCQPGDLVAQFGCFYDAEAMLYTAANDVNGEAKRLVFERPPAPREGIVMAWSWQLFAGGRRKRPFETHLAALRRTGDALSWHDAADRYRGWAERNAPWCAKKISDRDDLPHWMKDAPVFARLPDRSWFAKPGKTRRWLKRWYPMVCPEGAPLILAMWGWEKVCAWIGPDYFPCVPDDGTFAELVKDCRAAGAHCYPWPSGYHWTITFGPATNGVWRWDGRDLFASRDVAAHATVRRNGELHHSKLSWLEGGEAANLCYGDPWTLEWWNREVCLPLAKLGCELIQVDQVVGGFCPTCYSKKHGHAPGEGAWRWQMFERQLRTMRETMRTVEKDAVISVEEPQELFVGIVGLCDYRDCEAVADDWAGVYNYLYHEYAPVFQSNFRRENRHWQAYQAAEGQMPFLRICNDDIREDVRLRAHGEFMKRWIALWRGKGRDFLFLGRRVKPPVIRCRTQPYHSKHWDGTVDGPRPCVFGNAFRSRDGREALVFANATAERQPFAYSWRGKTFELELEPDEIRMIEQ